MLFKINDSFYIDFHEIYLIKKNGKDIEIFIKKGMDEFDKPFRLNSLTKTAKNFMKALDHFIAANRLIPIDKI